jgi:hypothetical protein
MMNVHQVPSCTGPPRCARYPGSVASCRLSSLLGVGSHAAGKGGRRSRQTYVRWRAASFVGGHYGYPQDEPKPIVAKG